MPETPVDLRLSADEALVLFELLHRWEDGDFYDQAELEPGEATALWAVSGALEKVLVEPFESDYETQVARARQRLHRRGGA
ncbi:hypothetical protein ACQBAU_08700 [Propionibacteriaceae bacterium Y2011]